jgi:predicted lipid-binding transport protein (Tim44 family)
VQWLFVLLTLVLLGGVAAARPGGGHSFSSGGSHSYSGGSHSYSHSGGTHYSGGGYGSSNATGGQVALVIIAVIGFFIACFVIAALIGRARERTESMYTSSAPIVPAAIFPTAQPVSLAAVRDVDPDFSRILFEDFAYELYAAAQRARHNPAELAKLTPYLSANARAELAKRYMQVEQVVIGSMSIVRAFEGEYVDYKTTRIMVRYESNLANRSGSTFAVERWTFERAIDRKTTPPPVGARTWPCPNCGAPWSQGDSDNVCAHCGTAITPGKLAWAVTEIAVEAETPVGMTLTGTTEEIGNDFPTVETGNPQADFHQLRTEDAALAWPSFVERIAFVYARLNAAWNAQDLTPVRGLVTHSLLQYLQYWIDEYKRQGLFNRLDNARVTRAVLSAVIRDPYYDAITVRVYGVGQDYTLDRKQNVVGGSRTLDRAYTEYWTFIRSAKRRGATVTAPNCPNCGAPLAISDAGACTHCNAHVESGEFDWVLSKIEQDDVYRG